MRLPSDRQAFTLLEVLVAMVILSSAFIMIWTTFTTTMKAWEDGSTLLEDLRHGDFVMEQLVSSLRSSAFFEESGRHYGFRMEDKTASRYPGDWLSWVTANSAFIPPDSPTLRSMHRVEFTIEDNPDGDPSVMVKAYPYLADEEEVDDAEEWYITSEVQGFDVQFYNADEEDWEDEWEDTNSVPALIQVALYMPPVERGDDPVTLHRLIEIPVAGTGVTNSVRSAEGSTRRSNRATDSESNTNQANNRNRRGTSNFQSPDTGGTRSSTISPGGADGR